MTIGITQRVEFNEDYNEVRDCLDQQWTNLMCKAEIDFILLPNSIDNLESWLNKKNLSGFILTGGNDLAFLQDAKNQAPNRDETERKILEWALKNQTKVLGVCRGMQLINCFLSGGLTRIKGHAGTKHTINVLSDNFYLGDKSEVNSFHDWGIYESDLSNDLLPMASANDGTIEAIVHEKLPWMGIMWHPERGDLKDSNCSIQLIKNFFQPKGIN
tara:strand:- start:12862 stop:13506 length:645 start_codon:yes stop_codon:yes gene_type:complete